MTEKTKTPATVIIIHETLTQSIAADLFTFAMVVSMVGLGIWVGSVPLQWLGAIMAMFGLVMKASGETKRLTIAEARARLDAIKRGEG